MPKITPYLWFDDQAEEAMQFYCSIFENSRIVSTIPGGPNGKILGGTFELDGQTFNALNGGPQFKFNEAISLFVECQGQAEVDEYWSKLTADGGQESRCGWLKDKYGLSWQIIPRQLGELLGDPDREKAGRVLEAMLKMDKIEVDKLHAAYAGG